MTRPPIPYELLPEVPGFDVTSPDVKDGERMDVRHASGVFGAGGEDVSPGLEWSGFPAETKSFAVTCFDPDAPTGSGFWHWAVYDLPASVTRLATGAGAHGKTELEGGGKQLENDARVRGFLGAAPPPGHGPHRYVFCVHALDVESLPIDPSVTPAVCGFNMFGHTLARAWIAPTYER